MKKDKDKAVSRCYGFISHLPGYEGRTGLPHEVCSWRINSHSFRLKSYYGNNSASSWAPGSYQNISVNNLYRRKQLLESEGTMQKADQKGVTLTTISSRIAAFPGKCRGDIVFLYPGPWGSSSELRGLSVRS